VADKKPSAEGRGEGQRQAARRRRRGPSFAEKFYISLAMAKRLVELHRAALERELKSR
jgi:hypothetical protein